MRPICSFPSPSTPPNRLTHTSPLPPHPSSSACPQRRAGLPGMSTGQGIARYNKAGHKPPCQGCMRRPSRRKRSHEPAKETLPPTPTARTPSEQPSHRCRGPSSDPRWRLCGCCFGLCEPPGGPADDVGHCFLSARARQPLWLPRRFLPIFHRAPRAPREGTG